MRINDLAIVLTQKIENDLVKTFFASELKAIRINEDVSFSDVKKSDLIPTFFNIRENILATLEEYLDVLIWTQKDSPMQLSQMPQDMRDEYLRHADKKVASGIIEKILDSEDHFDMSVYQDKEYYRSKTRYIAVLKSGKIARDSKR